MYDSIGRWEMSGGYCPLLVLLGQPKNPLPGQHPAAHGIDKGVEDWKQKRIVDD